MTDDDDDDDNVAPLPKRKQQSTVDDDDDDSCAIGVFMAPSAKKPQASVVVPVTCWSPVTNKCDGKLSRLELQALRKVVPNLGPVIGKPLLGIPESQGTITQKVNGSTIHLTCAVSDSTVVENVEKRFTGTKCAFVPVEELDVEKTLWGFDNVPHCDEKVLDRNVGSSDNPIALSGLLDQVGIYLTFHGVFVASSTTRAKDRKAWYIFVIIMTNFLCGAGDYANWRKKVTAEYKVAMKEQKKAAARKAGLEKQAEQVRRKKTKEAEQRAADTRELKSLLEQGAAADNTADDEEQPMKTMVTLIKFGSSPEEKELYALLAYRLPQGDSFEPCAGLASAEVTTKFGPGASVSVNRNPMKYTITGTDPLAIAAYLHSDWVPAMKTNFAASKRHVPVFQDRWFLAMPGRKTSKPAIYKPKKTARKPEERPPDYTYEFPNNGDDARRLARAFMVCRVLYRARKKVKLGARVFYPENRSKFTVKIWMHENGGCFDNIDQIVDSMKAWMATKGFTCKFDFTHDKSTATHSTTTHRTTAAGVVKHGTDALGSSELKERLGKNKAAHTELQGKMTELVTAGDFSKIATLAGHGEKLEAAIVRDEAALIKAVEREAAAKKQSSSAAAAKKKPSSAAAKTTPPPDMAALLAAQEEKFSALLAAQQKAAAEQQQQMLQMMHQMMLGQQSAAALVLPKSENEQAQAANDAARHNLAQQPESPTVDGVVEFMSSLKDAGDQ